MEETLNNDGFDLRSLIKRMPLAPFIIGGFWIIVLILAAVLQQNWIQLISDSIQRFALWGMIVLAMVPSIQSGTGPNFAVQVGICSGMLAMVVAIELGFTGMSFILIGALMAIFISLILGYFYGKLMNAVKGSEMAIATYTGLAITFAFYFIWLAVPFRSPFLGWFMGEGLRNTVALEPLESSQILDNIWRFNFLGLDIRLVPILIVLAACFLMWLFFRSKTGISISAVGANPTFAKAVGINVDRSRVIANMLSNAVAAVGVIVYAQSFGNIQLYDFPLWMAFPAVAAVLVGGASAQRSKVIHVIIGTFLFQGLLTTVPPVFSELLQGADMTDAARMVIQNGIILYALTRMRGGAK